MTLLISALTYWNYDNSTTKNNKVDSIIINSDLGTRTIEFSPDYVI